MSIRCSGQTGEHIDSFHNRIEQLHQRWDNKLTFPLAYLGKRYLRGDYGILIDYSTGQGQFVAGKNISCLSIAVLDKDAIGFDPHAGQNGHIRTTVDNHQLPVLVESVHIVHDANGVVFSVAPSLVGLQFPDEVENSGISDSLYFSLVSATFVFRKRKRVLSEYRELDRVLMFDSVLGAGEMPCNVVKVGTKMMNGLPTQDAKTNRDGKISMVVNSILPLLRVWIGDDWILASFEENVDLPLKIEDVLIGPL